MRRVIKAAGAALLLSLATVTVTGCGRSAASAPARDHSAEADGDGGSRSYSDTADYGGRRSGSSSYGGAQYERTREPIPQFHGEPMWSDNRQHSARENAEYHFHKSGADLGARTLDDFLTKVHRFADHPPAGTLHLTRANGDRLLYDPKSNIFVVVRQDGAPRTVFKPESGMDYWREQQARGSDDRGGYRRNGSGGYRSRSYGRSGGYGDRSYGRDD